MTPKSWRVSTLGSEIERIEGGGTPSKQQPVYWYGDIPWASVKDLKASLLSDTEEHISQLGLENSSSKLIPAGTVIIATRMALGKAVRFTRDVAINQDLKALFPKPTLTPDYLFHWYSSKAALVGSLGSGSTVKGIRLETLKALQLMLPPTIEQKKIATILASVDDAIERTQSLIAQLGRVKQAFLRHLVPGGQLPKGWRLTTLAEIADGKEGLQTGPFGSQLHAFEYAPEGIPVVMPKDIQNGQIMTATIARVPADVAARLERHRVKKNDILFARRGDIGRCGLVTEMEEGWLCGTGCLRARTTDDVNPEYLMQYLSLPDTVGWLVSNAVGQTMLNLNTSILGSLPILLPSHHEQDLIARSLRSIDQYGAAEFAYRNALDIAKRGLMDILLSGRKRIRLAQPVAATA